MKIPVLRPMYSVLLDPENYLAEKDIKRVLNDPDPLVRLVAKKTYDNMEYFQWLEEKKKK